MEILNNLFQIMGGTSSHAQTQSIEQLVQEQPGTRLTFDSIFETTTLDYVDTQSLS